MFAVKSARVSRGRIATMALALALAFCLGGFALMFSTQDCAYAANGSATALKSASIASADDEAILTTQLVKGRISDDRLRASMKMSYGDKTTVETNGASGKKVRWVSSNKKVVKVKSVGMFAGQFTAVGAGRATVAVYTGSNKLIVKVKVTGKLSKQSVSLGLFKKGSVKLKGAKVKSWKSADKKVAKISKKGAITPMATGQTTLTCKDTLGNKYKCTVTVTNPKITCKCVRSFKLSSAETGKTYYYKEFELTNKSGKKITLRYNALRYFEDVNANSYTDLVAVDAATVKYFDDNPVTVASGKSTKIIAAGEKELKETAKSGFITAFDVGKVRYAASFYTSGAPMLMSRV